MMTATNIKIGQPCLQASMAPFDASVPRQTADFSALSQQPNGGNSMGITDGETIYVSKVAQRIGFMAGKDDFRAARLRSALACEEYNKLAEDAAPEERMSKWLK